MVSDGNLLIESGATGAALLLEEDNTGMGQKHGEFRDLITEMFRERHKHPHLTVNLLRRHWEDILGLELARKTYPARISGNTLWINALDASWAYQLQFMKHELLESVQVFMDSRDVAELRFKQGALHASPCDEGEAKQAGGGGAETSPATSTASGSAAKNQDAGKSAGGGGKGGDTGSGDTDSGAEGSVDDTAGGATADVASNAIADPSLRDSFSRWARRNKRKKPPQPSA